MAQMNLSTKQAHIQNRLVVEGRMDWEFEISRWKVLYIRWINSKVLLYSTGNCIQCPVLNQNGKNMKNNYIYICIMNNLAVQQKLTTL